MPPRLKLDGYSTKRIARLVLYYPSPPCVLACQLLGKQGYAHTYPHQQTYKSPQSGNLSEKCVDA
jgi:hypothetical protein